MKVIATAVGNAWKICHERVELSLTLAQLCFNPLQLRDPPQITDEQRDVQEAVRRFVDDRVLPNAIENDINHFLDMGVIEGASSAIDQIDGLLAA